ncbi:hypothetical protein DFP72DRAFT_901525 [Ephemerocybe angulata]|uniref:DUF6699 domain-containing protein n=1 Tax=Ephemerocybe angulata TaxID=980116 RepID=A0A8H6M2Q4_9AGAR|nr:hypothetical protein DFP72DRAFT_901525 [Tulosesus angulatus]
MSRAVRFESHNLLSPDEYCTPQHHAYKGLNPKGILLDAGTFENGSKKGRVSSRRERRYSTPVQATSTMQNVATNDSYHHRHEHRSRRRSVSGDLLDSHKHHAPHQYDYGHYRAPHVPSSSSRRRDSSQPPPVSRTLLSPRSSSFTATPTQPRTSHLPPNRHDSRWHDEGNAFQAPYDPSSAYRGLEVPAAGYPGAPLFNAPVGFLYGSTAGTYSSSYYTPPMQVDTRSLPKDRSEPRSSSKQRTSALKDLVVYRPLKHPRIAWNIAFPFSSALFDSHSKLTMAELDQWATTPAIDRFTIKFEYTRTQQAIRSLWKSIKVRGSCSYTHNGSTVFLVTVRDVVNAVFDFFQIPITREEYALLTNSEAQMVMHAQRKRMGRNAYGFGDPLRVDLLGDYTRFEGVRTTSFTEKAVVFGLELSRW